MAMITCLIGVSWSEARRASGTRPPPEDPCTEPPEHATTPAIAATSAKPSAAEPRRIRPLFGVDGQPGRRLVQEVRSRVTRRNGLKLPLRPAEVKHVRDARTSNVGGS